MKTKKNNILKVNELNNEVDTLKQIIKDELWKEFTEYLSQQDKINSLRITIKRLRKNNSKLKEKIKNMEEKSGRIRKN